MRYKATIEVYTEAENESEALDIAGEYLRGAVNSDTPMSVSAIAVKKLKSVKIIAFACGMIAIAGVFLIGNRFSYYNIARSNKKSVNSYAVQPLIEVGSEEFKETWEKKQSNVINAFAR